MTTGRTRRFHTSVGLFTYRMIPVEAFRIGMDQIEIGDGRAFLMATPAKALADKLYDVRGIAIQSQKEMRNYLETNLRIDLAVLRELEPMELDDIALHYRSRKIRLLSDLVRRIQRQARKEGGYA